MGDSHVNRSANRVLSIRTITHTTDGNPASDCRIVSLAANIFHHLFEKLQFFMQFVSFIDQRRKRSSFSISTTFSCMPGNRMLDIICLNLASKHYAALLICLPHCSKRRLITARA